MATNPAIHQAVSGIRASAYTLRNQFEPGDAGFFEGYPAGRFLRLGGAEAPTC